MGVRLMAQTQITGDTLYSATHQDGGRIGLADPDSSNAGSLRPVISGSMPDDDGMEIEILDSGDAGTATFKWREPGSLGAGTWYGRGAFHNTAWGNETTILDNSTRGWGTSSHNPIGGMCQADNRRIVLTLSYDDSDGDSYASAGICLGTHSVTTDAITWSSVSEVATSTSEDCTAGKPVCLSSGRLLFPVCEGSGVEMWASDDSGYNWFLLATVSGFPHLRTMVELPNGNLLGAYVDSSANHYSAVSSDGGVTWGGSTSIVTPSTLSYGFDLLLLPSGDVIFAYSDSDTYDPIKAYRSTDGGTSWVGATDPMLAVAYDLSDPTLFLDVGGRVYCMAARNSTDYEIGIAYSDDNGGTWTYSEAVSAAEESGEDMRYPAACVVDGYKAVCAMTHTDGSDNLVINVDGGGWVTYAAGKEMPCAINLIKQYFTGAIKVRWEGGKGVDGDTYTAPAVYDHGAKNMVDADSPGRAWRTQSDNITGTDLITNGDFADWTGDDPDDWTVDNEDANNYVTEHANGAQLVSDNTANIKMSQYFTVTPGETYLCEIEVSDYTAGDIRYSVWDRTNLAYITPNTNLSVTAAGTYSFSFLAPTGCVSAKPAIGRNNTGSTDLVVANVSVADSNACHSKWDLTAYGQQNLNGVAFFGCNVRTLTFEANSSDSWGSPDIQETVSFDIENGTGTIDGTPSYNVIPMSTSWAENHKDHALAGLCFRATDGDAEGSTWKITDNVGEYIYLDADEATSLADTDGFAVYSSSAVAFFTAATVRWLRVIIPDQQTPNDCYQIGTMVACGSSDLERGWSVGYTRPTTIGQTLLEVPGGSLYPVVSRSERMEWGLSYAAQGIEGDVLAAVKHAIGYCMVLVPDDDATRPTPHLLYLLNDIEQTHVARSYYRVDVAFIEQPSPAVEDYVALGGGG